MHVILQGVANRDVKLENTLLVSSARPLIKLCDFGYSKDEKFQSAPGSKVGTPAYLAPEIISTTRGRTYDGKVRHAGCPISCLLERSSGKAGTVRGGYAWDWRCSQSASQLEMVC